MRQIEHGRGVARLTSADGESEPLGGAAAAQADGAETVLRRHGREAVELLLLLLRDQRPAHKRQ